MISFIPRGGWTNEKWLIASLIRDRDAILSLTPTQPLPIHHSLPYNCLVTQESCQSHDSECTRYIAKQLHCIASPGELVKRTQYCRVEHLMPL